MCASGATKAQGRGAAPHALAGQEPCFCQDQPQVRAQESRNTLGNNSTILSGINPVLWIWPVCRCVQWDQHWQGSFQPLKCFSLPGKGHGTDGLCLPSAGGSNEQLCGRGVCVSYLFPLKSWMCSQGAVGAGSDTAPAENGPFTRACNDRRRGNGFKRVGLDGILERNCSLGG